MTLFVLFLRESRSTFAWSTARHFIVGSSFRRTATFPTPYISTIPSFSHSRRQSRLFSQDQSTLDQELTNIKKQVQEALELCQKNMESSTDIHKLKAMVQDLEREQADPDFWDESNTDRAQTVNAQLSSTLRLLSRLERWTRWQGDCQAALEMLSDEDTLSIEERQMLMDELQTTTAQLLEDSQRYELELLLSGPYDQSPARIILTAGAGGTEANDWVADLKRMYERHCEKMGYTCKMEDSQEGDVVGYKSVELLVTGPNAYGWFQGEKGAHRLVRLSPFNANNKRQTTFAGVDVAPDVWNESDLQDVDLPESELEITTMRAGGKGGQNVSVLAVLASFVLTYLTLLAYIILTGK